MHASIRTWQAYMFRQCILREVTFFPLHSPMGVQIPLIVTKVRLLSTLFVLMLAALYCNTAFASFPAQANMTSGTNAALTAHLRRLFYSNFGVAVHLCPVVEQNLDLTQNSNSKANWCRQLVMRKLDRLVG